MVMSVPSEMNSQRAFLRFSIMFANVSLGMMVVLWRVVSKVCMAVCVLASGRFPVREWHIFCACLNDVLFLYMRIIL